MSPVNKESTPTEYKVVPAFLEVKEAKGDKDLGIVEHYVSIFGVEDLGSDVVHPGAFTKTLAERGGKIRVLDTHQKRSILNVLGVPLELKEVPRDKLSDEMLEKYPEATGGLWAKTQFLMDTPEGRGAFARIKAGAVSEFSFAYDTLDEDFDDAEDGHEIRNLRTVRLWEYGPVLFGMNPAAITVGAKGAPGAGEDEENLGASEALGGGDREGEEGQGANEDWEGKPAPDVTENTIRIRVRDPGGFQEGSFRTITIGKASDGIKAVIGRLKGKTTTTVQVYIFDKKKWTTERARKWVKSHGKSKALSYTRAVRVIQDAFDRDCNPHDRDGLRSYWVKEIFDEFLVVEENGTRAYFKVPYSIEGEVVEFVTRGEWVSGEYVFVERKKSASDEQGLNDAVLVRKIEVEQQLIENVVLLGETKAGPAL